MKVLCIDNKPHGISQYEDSLKRLKEGNVYSVINTKNDHDGTPVYLLKEVKSSHPGGCFRAVRFIPLSNIDETELVQHRELEKVRELCGDRSSR